MALLVACDGTVREQPSNTRPDAGPIAMVEPPPCDDPVAPTSDGHHHPGEDCLGCHSQGGEAPPYSFAGTVYDGPGGMAPVAGVTIHLIDSAGTDVIVTSQANGNFWSTDLVTFPVVAFGSACPDVVPMLVPLGDPDGSCNASGCHTSGFRIHVP